jgi:hypothetical protein
MNKTNRFFCFVLIIILMGVFSQKLYSKQNTKIRIIKTGAVLRVHPSESSPVIMELSLGGEFVFIEKSGDWMKIQLPPDSNSIVISGYVAQKFVEVVFPPRTESVPSTVPEKNTVQPAKRINLPVSPAASDENYYTWNRELESAKSRLRTGTGISTVGAIAALLGSILYFVDQEEIFEYDILGYEYSLKKKKTAYLVAAGGGALFSILGFSISSPAKNDIRLLEMEGARKGYIHTSVAFLKKGMAFTINYTF